MALKKYINRLKDRIKENKKVFILYMILRLLVLAALIRSIFIHNYEGAAGNEKSMVVQNEKSSFGSFIRNCYF